MNPNPFTKDVDHEERLFHNPTYALGWQKGLAHISDTSKYDKQICKLEQQAQLDKTCIKLMKARIEELETPWYTKLWNKIPRFSLSIRRTN
jgi:hypothetical protein